MLDSEGFDFDREVCSSKWKEKSEGIPIGFDGVICTSFNLWKVLIEELVKTGRKLHISS